MQESRKEYVQRRVSEMLARFELPESLLHIHSAGLILEHAPGEKVSTDGRVGSGKNQGKILDSSYCIRMDSDGDIVSIEVTTAVQVDSLRQALRQIDPRGVRPNAAPEVPKPVRRNVPHRVLRAQQNRAILALFSR